MIEVPIDKPEIIRIAHGALFDIHCRIAEML
jgi:hypothetical protein